MIARGALGAPAAAPAGAPARAIESPVGIPVEGAFQEFYERTARPLWAYLAAASRDPDLADDLAQESFVRLLATEFRPESEEHRRRYLFRIAGNLLRDHWRARKRVHEPLDPDRLLVDEREPAVELRGDLARGFARIKPRERQLLWLAHVEGLDHRAIAAALGLGPTSVRVLLFRARRRLAAAIDRPIPGALR